MISGSEFDERNGELWADDPQSEPVSEDGAENGVVTSEWIDGSVGNKNGMVEGDETRTLSADCSQRTYRGNVGEMGDVCGVFRRTYEDIGVSA
jgi:hypothetical protein